MDIFKIIGVGLITVIGSIILKQIKPEFSLILTLAGSILIIILIVDSLKSVLSSFFDIIEKTGINSELFLCVLKVIGVGYLVEFGAGICADTGNTSIADKILLAGKVLIMVICLPIIQALIKIILELVP